jgi:hypothetical protein
VTRHNLLIFFLTKISFHKIGKQDLKSKYGFAFAGNKKNKECCFILIIEKGCCLSRSIKLLKEDYSSREQSPHSCLPHTTTKGLLVLLLQV